jgi:serine/threonine protein phosphatase PrpC
MAMTSIAETGVTETGVAENSIAENSAEVSVRRGYWIVDPGSAKQSQDWICAGLDARTPSPPRRSWWPVGVPAAGAALALLLAIALAMPLPARGSLETDARLSAVGGLLAAFLLYAAVVAVRLVARARRSEDCAGRQRMRCASPAGDEANLEVTYTEAAEVAAAAGRTSGYTVAGIPAEDAALSDAAAFGRQAWEGEIPVEPPSTWPDRPLVVAIGDGVSSALRSAEISRLATRTAWQRTFYHLHALTSGAAPTAADPWMICPNTWPEGGPKRDRVLVQAMCRAFADANAAVIAAGQDFRRHNPAEPRSTATTLSLLAVDGARYCLVHVGDCSVYHVRRRSGTAEPRQVEHNRAAEYAQGDPLRYAEARRRRLHNVLTRWLGMSPQWETLNPQVLAPSNELAPGDALVLCSDGLDKHVDRVSVARSALFLDAAQAARRLVGLANDRGGTDHIAVAVLQAGVAGRMGFPAAAPWKLWPEDVATAFGRYGADTATLALSGVGTAALVTGALAHV